MTIRIRVMENIYAFFSLSQIHHCSVRLCYQTLTSRECPSPPLSFDNAAGQGVLLIESCCNMSSESVFVTAKSSPAFASFPKIGTSFSLAENWRSEQGRPETSHEAHASEWLERSTPLRVSDTLKYDSTSTLWAAAACLCVLPGRWGVRGTFRRVAGKKQLKTLRDFIRRWHVALFLSIQVNFVMK